MLAQELCKNVEGDPAKPGSAATTCWRHEDEVALFLFPDPVLPPFYLGPPKLTWRCRYGICFAARFFRFFLSARPFSRKAH